MASYFWYLKCFSRVCPCPHPIFPPPKSQQAVNYEEVFKEEQA